MNAWERSAESGERGPRYYENTNFNCTTNPSASVSALNIHRPDSYSALHTPHPTLRISHPAPHTPYSALHTRSPHSLSALFIQKKPSLLRVSDHVTFSSNYGLLVLSAESLPGISFTMGGVGGASRLFKALSRSLQIRSSVINEL